MKIPYLKERKKHKFQIIESIRWEVRGETALECVLKASFSKNSMKMKNISVMEFRKFEIYLKLPSTTFLTFF